MNSNLIKEQTETNLNPDQRDQTYTVEESVEINPKSTEQSCILIPSEAQTEQDNKLTIEDNNNNNWPFWPFIASTSIIAFPSAFYFLNLLWLQTINLVFIGQKYDNSNMIEAIGVVNWYMDCALMAIYTGLISGIETLCANAYAVKHFKLMGYYYQRARIVGYIVTTILVIIHFFTVQYILVLFGVNPIVIEYASKYIYSCWIYVFFDVQSNCIGRFLNVVEKSHINLIILWTSLLLHPLWNFIFITRLDMDVVGAGISFTLSKFIMFLFYTIYLWFYNPVVESNFWINRKCFNCKGLWNYLKFSIGAGFLITAEWWGCQLQSIIAMRISDWDYTVYVLTAEISGILYSLSVGFLLGITINTGELIAKSTIKQVKQSCVYGTLLGIVSNTVLLGIFYAFSDKIFNWFTSEKNVKELGTKVIPLIIVCEFFDLIQTCLVSIFRAVGRNYTASLFMFIHYYIIMLVLSIVFGIVYDYKIVGMYYGMALSFIIATFVYLVIWLFIDFEKAQKETIERWKTDNQLATALDEKIDDEGSEIHPEEQTSENNEEDAL